MMQEVDERQIAHNLGSTLDREQRLIKLQGSQRVGTQQLSHYRFRHILFQQYLYGSLDPIQRMTLHRAIAQELEQSYGCEVEQMASQLARHYVIAGDNPLAMHYFMVAGDMAAAIYANSEAVAHYRHALRLIKRDEGDSGQPIQNHRLRQLYTSLGRILELCSQHDEAITLYEEMERVGQERKDQEMALASLLARAAIRATVNFARNPTKARDLLERARTLALDLEDQASEAGIFWNLLILSAYTGGDMHERLAYGEQALALARSVGLPERLAYTLHDIFYAYAGVDQWDRAREALTEARDLWQRLGNLPMLRSPAAAAWTYLVTGEYEETLAHTEEAYRLGVESHDVDAQALSHLT